MNSKNDAKATLGKEERRMFALTSSAFVNGGTIPDKFVEDSLISPPIKWENSPKGTECFFLIMTDQDIPQQYRENLGRGFVHWIASIPGSVSELPGGASPGNMPSGSGEYKTDYVTFSTPGYGSHYGGPWPPDIACNRSPRKRTVRSG